MRLVYITIGWVLGIIVASTFPQLLSRGLWFIWSVLAIFALFILRHDKRLFIALVVGAFAWGGLRYQFVPQTSGIALFNNSGGLTIQGIVVAEPDKRDDSIRLRVAVNNVFTGIYEGPVDGLVLVKAPILTDIRYGDSIQATGELITPAEYDTFSYADFLGRSGIFSIMDNAVIQVLSRGHGNPLYAVLLDVKTRVKIIITQALPDPAAALLSGILLGDESGISPQLADDFSRVGASHIIAISGFNMAVVSGVVTALLGQLLPERKRFVAGLGVAFIIGYTLLVGANSAVVRAAIMSSLLIIGGALKRKTFVPASLAFVVLLMSLQSPSVLWDISFQLSFFAVLGMALFVAPLSRALDRLFASFLPPMVAVSVKNFIQEPVVVSIAAQLTTLPLILIYFQRFSIVAIPVNLLIVPVQSGLLIIGGLAVLCAFIAPALSQLLFWVALLLLSWTIGIVRATAQLPFADIAFTLDTRLLALLLISYIGGAMITATRPPWFIMVARWLQRRIIVMGTLVASSAIMVLMLLMVASRPDGLLHVWFLDMGHSNAILLQSSGGAHILIDGGRFPSRLLTALGDRLPFYDRELEIVIMTHPDEFDMGALPSVLSRYHVKTMLITDQPNERPAVVETINTMAASDVVAVRAGYTAQFSDGLTLTILHPQKRPSIEDNFGDTMMIIRAQYGDISFLLTSDASVNAQRALLAAGYWPASDILQLPQHGTIASLDEAFYRAVSPSAIALQSDIANRRGDPNADVLAQLGDTPLFRTDQVGTLHFWTDGRDVWYAPEN